MSNRERLLLQSQISIDPKPLAFQTKGDTMLPKIAVIGSGYWGKNLVRNFHALGVLKSVCDSRTEALQEAQKQFGVNTCFSLNAVLGDDEIRGVAIAAPAVR